MDDSNEFLMRSWKFVLQCEVCNSLFGTDYEKTKQLCPKCDPSFSWKNRRAMRVIDKTEKGELDKDDNVVTTPQFTKDLNTTTTTYNHDKN